MYYISIFILLQFLTIIVLLSQIQAMNFWSFTSRGHSPITWTFTPHSQSQITQGLHFPSSTAPTQLSALITHTPENNLTITITQSHTHTHTHTLHNPGFSPTHCRVLLVCLHTKRFLIPSLITRVSGYSLCFALWTLIIPRLDYCSSLWIISLPSPLDTVR